MKHCILVIFFLCSSAVFAQTSCDKLPQNYASFSEAKAKIKSAKFLFTDFVNTDKSSWIKGATYYSCDKKVGFFLLRTDKEEYIFKNIPIDIWLGFKKAESFGKYYHRYIKGNYNYLTYDNIKK